MSKDVNTLTPEELMEIAKLKIKDDELKDLSPVKRFIVSEGISKGNYAVQAAIIYLRYEKWCHIFIQPVLSESKFFKEFAQYFEKKRDPAGMMYVLDNEGFDSMTNYTIRKRKSPSEKTKKTNTSKNS